VTSLNGTVNGATKAVPPWDGWRPITLPTHQTETAQHPEAAPAAEPAIDHIALAEADRLRKLGEAEAQAKLIEAEGKAEAERIKAAEEARQLKLANDKAEQQARERQEASEARIAESRRKREETERARAQAARQAEDQQKAEADRQKKIDKSATSWRRYALGFAIVCAIVALPVQMSAFYSRSAPWLLAAPLVLEGGAWVVLKGAAAAVDEHRPHWHYRLIAWTLAALAAGINLSHGLTHFGRATAIGTAFASLAGPGVWDLHEHGRIRTRDGKLTRRERKARERAEKRAAAEKAAERQRIEREKAAAAKAAEEAAKKLAEDREELYPDVWQHAKSVAAALGEATVTEAVWRRAYKDVKGTDPGDSPEAQQLRNAAARRLLDARADAPDKAVWKTPGAQVNPQVPPTRRRGSVTGPPVRGVRRTGDVAPFVQAARNQASITAKNAIENTARED
jgi:chemotaxis protein histidine kinase CheA